MNVWSFSQFLICSVLLKRANSAGVGQWRGLGTPLPRHAEKLNTDRPLKLSSDSRYSLFTCTNTKRVAVH